MTSSSRNCEGVEDLYRIIHGLSDQEVDPNQSLSLGKALQSSDVDLIFRKNSGHVVHEPHDLELFLVTLDR